MSESAAIQEVKSKYRALLKSCRNIVTEQDIQVVRKAFDAVRESEGGLRRVAEEDLIRLLDIGLIVTSEIGLGRTSVICVMLHPLVETGGVADEEIRSAFGDKVAQILQGLRDINRIYREHPVVNAFFDRVIGLIDRQGEKIAALIRKDFGDKAAENLTPDILHWFSHLQVDMIFYLIEHETEEGQAEMQVRHMVRFLRGGLYSMIRSGKLTEEKNQNR